MNLISKTHNAQNCTCVPPYASSVFRNCLPTILYRTLYVQMTVYTILTHSCIIICVSYATGFV